MATCEASFNEKFNCWSCLNQYKGKNEKQRDILIDRLKRKKGCTRDAPRPWRVENIRFNKCIGNYTSKQVRYLLDSFLLFEKGVMPFEGALMEQPAKIIEVFNMIQSVRDEKERLRQDALEREARLQNRKMR